MILAPFDNYAAAQHYAQHPFHLASMCDYNEKKCISPPGAYSFYLLWYQILAFRMLICQTGFDKEWHDWLFLKANKLSWEWGVSLIQLKEKVANNVS